MNTNTLILIIISKSSNFSLSSGKNKSQLNIDFIIVGQGLAGTVLAYSLLKYSAKILIIDRGLDKGASKSAAGIFNPITGRQMRKTWKAEELFQSIPSFYGEIEEKLNQKLLYPMPVLRMFDSQKQINDWYRKGDIPRWLKVITAIKIQRHVF